MKWPWEGWSRKTTVYLRSMGKYHPAMRGEAVVKYDAWGSPYVENHNLSYPLRLAMMLHEDGTTDSTIYGTEWKHKSGPPVVWPKSIPKRPFGRG